RGYRSAVAYDHFSVLRTIEENWDLAPLNTNDSSAPSMAAFLVEGPVARFVSSPTWPQGNETVTFNASTSSSSAPNSTLQFRWDWTDDGTWDTPWSTSPIAEHAYTPAGVYTAELQVQDALGSTNETTHPIPVDDAAPVTTASLSGPTGQGDWYRGPVTVTLTATDDRSGVASTTYRIDDGGPQTYTSPFDVTGDGNHTVSFGSIDRATNAEGSKEETFRIDSMAPITSATFSGLLNGSVFVDPILVTLTATDDTSGVANTSVSIDGLTGTNYTVPFLVPNVGSHSVVYFSFDRAGNVEAAKEFSVVNGTILGIVLDSRAFLIGTAGSSGWYTSAVNVTLLLMNGTSPPDSIWYRLDNGTWTQYAASFVVVGDGVHTLDFNATDGAGLNEIVHHLTISIDTALPASSAAVVGTSGNNGWYISNATVSLGATDATSGVRGITYRIDGLDWLDYAGPLSLGEGPHLVEYYATDVAGLAESVRSQTVNVDMTPPASAASVSGTTGANGWFVSNVTVSLSATDALSGVDRITYRIDGRNWSTYAGPFVLTDGQHLVEYLAADLAGLTEAVRSIAISVDTAPPSSVVAISGQSGANGWFISNVTVVLNATDATSGVASISYKIDTGAWLAYAGPFLLGEGRHHVEYYATDVAGIVETLHTLDVSIDITAPTVVASVSGTLGANGWYVSDVAVSLNGSDATSGLASLSYRVDGLVWTTYSGAFVLTDGRHLVEYFATDFAGLSGPIQSLTVAVDTTPPATVATLTGQAGSNGWFVSNVTVILNATDALSGIANLSYRIDNGSWQAYSAPFLLAEGLHQVDFLAIDLAGNVEVLQSLNVAIDTTPPISSAIVSGTLGSNGWYVSNATISLTAIDATSGIARIVYRIDGGVWTNYSGFFVVSEGTHTIEFFAIDLAGITEGIHSITVDVDTTGPSSSAALSGRSGTDGWYISNVTVFLNATDATSGVATVTYRVDQGAWQLYLAPFVVTEGEHQIDFFATDVAGNAEPLRSAYVAIDSTPPTTSAAVSGAVGSNGWFVSNATVSLNASDSLSGVGGISYRIDAGPWNDYSGPFLVSEGTHTIEFFAVDRAGNEEAIRSIAVSVDTMAPSSIADLSGQSGANGWFVSNVSVSLNASDATSGVAAIWYRIDGGGWTLFAGPFGLAEGRHQVDYYAVDQAGNVEPVNSVDVGIDTTPPTTSASLSGTAGENGWYVSNVTVTLTASDGTSGVATLVYRVDGGAWLTYSVPFALQDGVHTIDYFATDVAGLVEPQESVAVQIDTMPPTTAAESSGTAGANGWFVSSVTVFLNASDATSGIANITYRVDGGPWSVYAGPFVLADGVHVVEFFATDLAGITEPIRSLSIAIDTTPPVTEATLAGTLGQGGWYTSAVTFSVHASDPGSGIANVNCRVDGGTWTSLCAGVVLGEGVHSVEFYATNGAGLVESTQSITVMIDVTPPATIDTLTGELGDNGWYRSNVTVSFNATDAPSGVAGIQYRIDGGARVAYSAPFILLDGQHVLDFFAIDVAGNVEALQSVTIRINTVAPLTTALISGTSGNDGWYVSNVTVTLSASDGTGGVKQVLYRLDGGGWRAYSDPIMLREGRHILEYYSTDWAGNPEPEHSKAIDIDTTDPMASASVPSPSGHDGWYLSALSVQLEASDATSGVTGLFYQVDGGGWQHYTVPFMIGTGQHLVRFYSTDLAGRSSPVGSLSLNVDPTAPTTRGTLAATMGSNGWYVSDVVVTLSAFDGVSGIATVEYRVNDGPWLSYSGPFTLSDGGAYVVEFAAVDVAGNQDSLHRITFKIDQAGPAFLSLTSSGNATGSPVLISWEATDNDSGIAGYEVRVDNGPFTSLGGVTAVLLNLSEGSHVVQVRATDRAGVSTTRSISIHMLTATKPSGGPGLPAFLIPMVLVGAGVAAAAFALWGIRNRRKRTKG
ncbi:MAG: PKD domain-containing protein, partial [Methanobacteriota archaeon]